MKLELAEFPVERIRLGRRFAYAEATLEVDEAALLELVQRDSRVRAARLAVAVPGENTRITGIRDIVEPRVKVSGRGAVFPGILGPVESVGEGRTHRLSGMAVAACAAYEGTIRAGTTVQRSGILDLSGPGAEVSRFASLKLLVLNFELDSALPELEAHQAIQIAELSVAQKIAEVTRDLAPSRVQTYDLTTSHSDLPTAVLIQGCVTDPQHVHSGIGYYGMSLRESLATFVHPNEIFDGAVTVDTTRSGRAYYPATWDWQNHPLILGLYAEHGRRLNFGGVVLQRIRFETAQGKTVGAENAALLAKTLGADGALVTWIGGGNPFIDVMFTVRACERRGVKTTLVTYENGGTRGTDSPVLYYLQEANAVVSTGSLDRPITLPEVEEIHGPYEKIKIFPFPGAAPVPARESLALETRDVMIGGTDIWGQQARKCEEF